MQKVWNISLILKNFKIDFPLILSQLFIASAILATAFAAGPPAYGAPAPYAPEKLPPQPYKYEYRVADVTYKGTPVYPPEPKEGYRRAARAYRPDAIRAYRPSFRGYMPGFYVPTVPY